MIDPATPHQPVEPALASILQCDLAGLTATLATLQEPAFRAKQIWGWLHGQRVHSFNEMTNLSKDLRSKLAATFSIGSLAESERKVSADGLTEKVLYTVALDQNAAPPFAVDPRLPLFPSRDAGGRRVGYIEAVLIREQRLKRQTVCVSCAVGCPIGCVFCATGTMDFERNLSKAVILEQIYRIDERAQATPNAPLAKTPAGHQRGLTNVVFMGMGEPLLNYDAVVGSIRQLNDPLGFGLGGRQITISTVGVIEGIERLTAEGLNVRLAVSLHAPNQDLRQALIPTAHKWPLTDLLKAVRAFAADSSRHVTFEYTLIDGINSEVAQAKELAAVLRGIPCKVNAIPLNPTDHYRGKPPSRAAAHQFQQFLEAAGIACTIRTEKGQDINAACGQLHVRKERAAQNRLAQPTTDLE